MDQMAPTDRGREIARLWNARRDAIVAALPFRMPDGRHPDGWLVSARARLDAPELAGVRPDALVAAVEAAAADGVLVAEGRIVPAGDSDAEWVPDARGMAAMLMRCEPEMHVRCDIVCPGDFLQIETAAGGRVRYLGHFRDPDLPRVGWRQAFATATIVGGPKAMREHVVLDRAEVERQAAAFLRLPAAESSADVALRVVLIRLFQALPLERAWDPWRRLDRAIRRIWTEPKAERAAA